MVIRIIIADRQDMFREALSRLLELQPDLSVVADTDDGDQLIQLVKRHKPDVILLDYELRRPSALGILKQLSALKTDVRPILLTDAIEKKDVVGGLLCGARGVIPKAESTDLLFKGIRAVMEGEYWISRDKVWDLVGNLRSLSLLVARNEDIRARGLSSRQKHIVDAIISGYSNKEIAQELSVSERAVKYHVTRIFHKYGICSRMELVQHTFKNSFASISQ